MANQNRLAGLLLACTLIGSTSALAAQPAGRFTHAMTVTLDPVAHRLTVDDRVTVPVRPPGGVLDFVLNGALKIAQADPAVHEVPLGDDVRFFGINGAGGEGRGPLRLKRYRSRLPAGGTTLSLRYEGVVNFGLSDQKEEYTRGFRETAGILGAEGVYLAGSSFWYPVFNRDLLEFDVQVAEPEGWHVISQGNGTSRDERGRARWESGGPMDEIDLVGGPLRVWRDAAGGVETLVYLHDADEGVASKYLAATAQYLEMYRQLIGPYPYKKFALVENFWETGYGMPTFTLLGREIIRFPFIINSSYPHEILHNWWGNSVFVDYESGNWCEGLTAYLADHLIQEQRGTGDEYRRSTLQKYRDYVKAGRDFPLTAFRSRESASTEAVGYGKALMAFHMLRLQLGDDAFRKTIATFYRDYKGKRASFADFRKTAETVAGRSLARFFADWTTRAGAPVLGLSVARVSRGNGGAGFVVEGVLRQGQAGAPFAVDVPIVVQTAKGAVQQVVHSESPRQVFTVTVADAPVMVHADPRFDVFRRLDPRETPPSIGQIFGEPRVLAVLPASAPAAELAAWRELFKGWQSASHVIEIRLDSAVAALPRDRAVWIAGRSNRFADKIVRANGEMTVGQAGVEVDGEKMPLAGHTLVLVARHPLNVEKAIGYLAVDPIAAFPGLGRKLPHYGKYSYLGFEGDEPVNVLKGQWQQSGSPLRVDVRALVRRLERPGTSGAAGLPRVAPLAPDGRRALADLPPAFSRKALVDHVAFLADPRRQGRGPGSEGHEAAAQYIADAFKSFGLQPGGPEGSYFQRFTMAVGPGRETKTVANVIGVIPGTRAEWKAQSVLVTAHYDHLGLGWPDAHKGDEGRVHPGADDNASGVAVMLELAHALAGSEKPARSILFVAFTGEEAGLQGSRYYVEHADAFPVGRIMGVINLDTVGRLQDQKLSVIGTSTASEWPHIFRGASFVTGVESRAIPEAMQASDQASFVTVGVPAVQIFTGAHADYHRPTDTVDRIDGAGLVKVATFVKEGVTYLAERAEPLTNTIAAAGGGAGSVPPASGTAAPSGRRVSFGSVPDFTFQGPGVRVAGVVAGSPAEKAGLKEGDVVLALDDKPVSNLQGFSALLATLKPGQTVTAKVTRQGTTLSIAVTLAER